MSVVERDPAFTARDRRVHKGMVRWASSHFDDFIGELGFDPASPYQWVERALLPAEADLEVAQRFGKAGMGPDAYQAMLDGFKKIGAVDLVRETSQNNANQKKEASTLFATLHTKSTLDTALTHNGLAVASGDPEFADMNVVLANYIMSAMTVGGVAVDWALTRSGKELRALPDAALEYISQEDFEFINRIALSSLNRELRRGVAIHQALSGTRAKPATRISDGADILVVPTIDSDTARMVVNKSPTAVGVPMQVKPGDSSVVVMEPRRLTSEEDVHELMNEMVEEVNVFSDTLVVYGLSRGLELVRRAA